MKPSAHRVASRYAGLSGVQERNLALLREHGAIIYSSVDKHDYFGKLKLGPDRTRTRTKGANMTALLSLVKLGLAEMQDLSGEDPGFSEARKHSRRWRSYRFTPAEP